MKLFKSDYHYEFVDNVLLIIDENQGNKSVTNDIKNVLLEIAHNENMTIDQLKSHKIAYQDSMKIWDGVDISKGNTTFYHIGLSSGREVLQYFKQKSA